MYQCRYAHTFVYHSRSCLWTPLLDMGLINPGLRSPSDEPANVLCLLWAGSCMYLESRQFLRVVNQGLAHCGSLVSFCSMSLTGVCTEYEERVWEWKMKTPLLKVKGMVSARYWTSAGFTSALLATNVCDCLSQTCLAVESNIIAHFLCGIFTMPVNVTKPETWIAGGENTSRAETSVYLYLLCSAFRYGSCCHFLRTRDLFTCTQK